MWLFLQGKSTMSPPVLSIRCVAACRCCTHTTALHRSTSIFHEPSWLPRFLFPWTHCSQMQTPPTTTDWLLARYQPWDGYSATGWHGCGWLMSPVPAGLTVHTTLASFHNNWQFQHDSATFDGRWICRNVTDRKISCACSFVPGWGTYNRKNLSKPSTIHA